MTNIKRRQPAVETWIAQGQIIASLVLVVYSQIGQALARGVFVRPIQGLGEALPEVNLQAVVAAPSAVIHEAQGGVVVSADRVGIEQQEVDQISPRLVGKRLNPRPCARAEVAAEHAAYTDLVSGQRVSQGPSLAVRSEEHT